MSQREAFEPIEPSGEVAIRTIAMPADTNVNGDIFGGWLMSQMDLAAGTIRASPGAQSGGKRLP